MPIGVSAPTGFLTGVSLGPEDDFWFRMYGSSGRFLDDLLELGVASVELRDARSVADPGVVREAISVVCEAGLAVTVHLWLPMDDGTLPPIFVASLDGLETCRPEAAPNGDPMAGQSARVGRAPGAGPREGIERVPTALHGHDRLDFASAEDAMRATVRDLKALTTRLRGSRLRPAFELCRVKPDAPVGTSFEELLSIADALGDHDLAFCWDMGHGLDNHRRQGYPLVAPDTFLTRVVHTHIHDLDARGKTHGPVSPDSAAVATMVRALRDSGYDGVYNLELEPTRWPAVPETCRRWVADSVRALADMLG